VRADKNIWNNKAAIYLQIENLMNIQYADFLGAKMPGRWLMSGIRFNIQRMKEY
jgi:iron complex outermembrane receptor protein